MPLPTMHPGRTLLGELLARDWKLSELAERLDETPDHIRDILMEYVDLTPDLAAKIAAVMGTSEAFWLNMQARHSAATNQPETVEAK